MIKLKNYRRKKQSKRIQKAILKMVSKVPSRQFLLVAFTHLILSIISKLLSNRLIMLIIYLVNQVIFYKKTKTSPIRRCHIIQILRQTCMLKTICKKWQENPSNSRARVRLQASRSRWPRRLRMLSSRRCRSMSLSNRGTSRLMAIAFSTLRIQYRLLEDI